MFNRVSAHNCENLEDECFCLFKSVKQTVEWLLSGYSPNVWNTYGSLSRLCSIIDEIFMHGLISETSQKYWEFVNILFVSDPRLNVFPQLIQTPNNAISKQLCDQWLEKSLLEHNLSNQLQKLLQDEQHVSRYYKKTAFLQNKQCTNALLLCLRAVEHNQPSLLTDLDPLLIVKTLVLNERKPIVNQEFINSMNDICDNAKDIFETSSSLDYVTPPESLCDFSAANLATQLVDTNGNCTGLISSVPPIQIKNEISSLSSIHLSGGSCVVSESLIDNPLKSIVSNSIDSILCKIENFSQNLPTSQTVSNSDVTVSVSPTSSSIQRSSPDLNAQNEISSRTGSCSTENCLCMEWQVVSDSLTVTEISCDETRPSSPLEDETAEILEKSSISSWKAQHSRSKSDGTTAIPNNTSEEMETCSNENFSSSLPSIFMEEEKKRRKSIFEEQVVVSTECFFPRPHPGQTLTSFLSSKDFNICAELDKENAHFFIAEALISAIEQVKCEQSVKQATEEMESDEEIKELTQRIRIRRREKMREKVIKSLPLLSDGKTDTTTSASPKSSTHSSEFDAESINSEEDEIDIDISEHTQSNLNSVKESGVSLSMASLYSDADLKKALASQPNKISAEEKRTYLENNGANFSAEAIALSLLKRFSEKQLPKASDLQWLISEEESGQKLLPLPDSWPVSPDCVEEDYDLEKIRLRGNLEWAPPRRQIIFMIQAEPNRKVAIQKQKFRCAGCGMKIEKTYVKKFRYCEYLGKFFCQCCHSNNLFYIPARILWKWDFRHYYVSKFSWTLLDQMYTEPLFNVSGINDTLYKKVRQLNTCKDYRTQLFYIKDFIRTCRKADKIQNELEKQPHHILNDPHHYSLSDFVQVKSGELPNCLNSLVSRCIAHVTQCILCRAKGFICEMCNKDKDVIFPFQLSKVVHCPECGSCFHKKCHQVGVCPKCIRIKARKQKLMEQENEQFQE